MSNSHCGWVSSMKSSPRNQVDSIGEWLWMRIDIVPSVISGLAGARLGFGLMEVWCIPGV